MGSTGDRDERSCQHCGKTGSTVHSRGRIDLIAELCDTCWNELANRTAQDEGATAPPRPNPDPDDVTSMEPQTCALCNADIHVYPTVYDRWVSLAVTELPAKAVPECFRWRLVRIQTPRSPVVIDVVAVRVRGIDPLPGDLVRPAHQMLCSGQMAERPPVMGPLPRDISG
ncbi:DUF6083 domain-containing protein [Streptomyces sp. AC512_CC834]|uniref:DUF6083 domain-containing protein n=1 Tax=Streptomyces sp. AC512_CC834 TaxID=2823691 RepID=UPI0027E41170|nr:DUF6083 domain-containing protein [Streptomyces sp. AC512_CC834]